jgi:hypothetical protein
MRYPMWIAVLSALMIASAGAATCANGVYRAGCVGPNGAAVVRKPPVVRHYYAPRTVTCANGVYRAGCAGPNGAAVVRKPPY